GQPSGPVGDRRQDEACNDGAEIAEQHFMDMPGKRRKGAGQGGAVREKPEPERDSGRCVDAGKQEEGTKPVMQQGTRRAEAPAPVPRALTLAQPSPRHGAIPCGCGFVFKWARWSGVHL